MDGIWRVAKKAGDVRGSHAGIAEGQGGCAVQGHEPSQGAAVCCAPPPSHAAFEIHAGQQQRQLFHQHLHRVNDWCKWQATVYMQRCYQNLN